MNEDQLIAVKNKYHITERFSNEHMNMYRDDIDKTNDFYDTYVDIYGDIEQIKNLNQDKDKKISFDIDYEPFKDFHRMEMGQCIEVEDISKMIMLNSADKYEYNELDSARFNKGHHFYKTMDGFYTIEDEDRFIKKSKNTPFWFSSPYFSYLAVSARHGGINSYKTTKTANVLIINCDNIKKIIKLVKEKEEIGRAHV